MKLGAFGIIRLGIQLFPEGAEFWMPALVVLAVINILYGAVSAMGQTDFKYVIGYSSVSHMGYVLLGLATMSEVGINGAAMQMFSHGLMTAPHVRHGRSDLRPGSHSRDSGIRRTDRKDATRCDLLYDRRAYIGRATGNVRIRRRV